MLGQALTPMQGLLKVLHAFLHQSLHESLAFPLEILDLGGSLGSAPEAVAP